MRLVTSPESAAAPKPAKSSSIRKDEQEWRDARFAMRISLAVGVIMLVSKLAAFFMTQSAAVFSDTAESDERITSFSAGFEGAMIILAAVAILVAAIRQMDDGSLAGKSRDGHAVSARRVTRWKPFDPRVAIVIAGNILWSGGRLVGGRGRFARLLRSPERAGRSEKNCIPGAKNSGVTYHGVRLRTAGYRQIIEVHLLFPHLMPVGEAHRLATILDDHAAPAEHSIGGHNPPGIARRPRASA